jgi:hypothetical protein
MAGNPLIQRYRYSVLRPRQFWIYVTIYISIILLLVSINYAGYKSQEIFSDILELHRSLYYQFLTFQIIMLIIWGAYNSGSAIKEEILNKSFDFFRMLPLPAHKKALGILIGKNLLVLLFGAINLAFLIYFGSVGGINIILQGQVLLMLLSITILANTTSLLSSINLTRKNKSSGLVLILLAIFFLMPMVINAIIALSTIDELQDYLVYFFNIKSPILLLISFIVLYFCCWVFKGILRRFTHEQEPLFTRAGAILFLLGYNFIVIGLYYVHIPEEGAREIHSMWLSMLIPVLLIPWGSSRNLDNYIEYSRDFHIKSTSGKRSILPILKYSNLSLFIALFAIWAVFSMGITVFADNADMNPLSNIYDIFVLLTCYLFLSLLLELYIVYMPHSNKIGLLVGFIAILYLILPLILSGIFHNKVISFYSPFGFIASIFDDSSTNVTIKTTFWLMNALFCIVPALLIRNRYNFILSQREKMQNCSPINL